VQHASLEHLLKQLHQHGNFPLEWLKPWWCWAI
jgi:hypothetical protein